jgi:hypothetical protein
MTALALRDEHPPLAETEVLEPQAEHLAAAQTDNQHGLNHRPVAFGAKRRHQRLDLARLEVARQPAHTSHQRHHAPFAAMPALRVCNPRGTGLAATSPRATR